MPEKWSLLSLIKEAQETCLSLHHVRAQCKGTIYESQENPRQIATPQHFDLRHPPPDSLSHAHLQYFC